MWLFLWAQVLGWWSSSQGWFLGGVMWGDRMSSDDWLGVVHWAGLGYWGGEVVQMSDNIANKVPGCSRRLQQQSELPVKPQWEFQMWGFKVQDFSTCPHTPHHPLLPQPPLPHHFPHSISLGLCSIFSRTIGRYCLRQDITLTAEALHQWFLHLNLHRLIFIPIVTWMCWGYITSDMKRILK